LGDAELRRRPLLDPLAVDEDALLRVVRLKLAQGGADAPLEILDRVVPVSAPNVEVHRALRTIDITDNVRSDPQEENVLGHGRHLHRSSSPPSARWRSPAADKPKFADRSWDA
jgi:hypothetical protein